MATPETRKWAFKARFRRRAFGWRSQPAIQRVREAVSEIKKVRGKNPVLAAEGAVVFLERVSPALEQVDSSSGAIGTAVNRAIDALVPIIAEAPVDDARRRAWLERLLDALQDDQIPYIERLGDLWGDLCVNPEIASEQADGLLSITRRVLAPGGQPGEFFSGTSACLSALYKAERYEDLVEIAGGEHVFWAYKVWAVRALAAQGSKADALRLAESSRGPWSSDLEIDRMGDVGHGSPFATTTKEDTPLPGAVKVPGRGTCDRPAERGHRRHRRRCGGGPTAGTKERAARPDGRG